MISRRAAYAVLLCGVFAVACSGGPPSAANPNALARANDAGVLRAAFITYPPSFITAADGSQKSGIRLEAMAKAAAALNLKIDYVEETPGHLDQW